MSRNREKEYLRSGELARLAEVSTDTLRHYERKGLLPSPRRSLNNYREYPAGSVARVRLVQRALEVGFTLDELAQILGVRDRGGAPCHRVRELAADKLARVEAHLEQLTELREDLRGLLSRWDDLLAKKSPSERAGLLESLAAGRELSRTKHTITRTHIKRRKGRETLW